MTSRASGLTSGDLADELRAKIRGEVRFDDGGRALYATDGSNYRQVPIGVVIPRDSEDITETFWPRRAWRAHSFARRRHEPGRSVLQRRGGDGHVEILQQRACNRSAKRLGRVQPGSVLDHAREAAEKHGLTFGPDPATHNHCTLGGMIGNNSCGVHSVMAQFAGTGARTSDNLHELEILTYEG